MSKEHFYIDTKGNDDAAYREAMEHACKLAAADPDIKRVVLLVLTKNNTDWFERLFGPQVVKELHKGYHFKDCRPIFKFETTRTYKDGFSPSEIVITCALDDDDVLKIENFISPKAVIAIPWLPEKLKKWRQTYTPTELRGKQSTSNNALDLSCVVKTAMTELTASINTTTGITHPMDNERAKTFILSLHKYEPSLDANAVGSYLIRDLNWKTTHAQDIEKLVNTLNDGKFFKGGDRTGLQHHYKRWKDECNSKN